MHADNDDYWEELADAPPITADELCLLSKKAAHASGRDEFGHGTIQP